MRSADESGVPDRYRKAAPRKSTTTTDITAVSTWFVRALALMPRRFIIVNVPEKSASQTGKGTPGRMFSAALLHQMVQMIGLST